MIEGQREDGDDVGAKLLLTVLLLGVFVSGCVSKLEGPSTTAPSETVAPVEEVGDEIPTVGEVTEEELTPEPDLDVNDTVDLGSLL